MLSKLCEYSKKEITSLTILEILEELVLLLGKLKQMRN